jgi:cytochrome c
VRTVDAAFPFGFWLLLSFDGFVMRSICLIASALACASTSVHALDAAAAMELAKANGCYSCHANNEKVVGPAYASVAEKYKGDKDAVASLAQSIQNGSKGKWGRIPMPAHPSMSAADIKALATWVLTVK